jgi:hypothetical protein
VEKKDTSPSLFKITSSDKFKTTLLLFSVKKRSHEGNASNLKSDLNWNDEKRTSGQLHQCSTIPPGERMIELPPDSSYCHYCRGMGIKMNCFLIFTTPDIPILRSHQNIVSRRFD